MKHRIAKTITWTMILGLGLAISLAAIDGDGAGSEGPIALGITQIDSSRLMAFQKNRLYVRALDARGEILDAAALTGSQRTISLEVHESSDGKTFVPAGKARILAASPKDEGINFLFLIDNSLSMYWDMAGKPTESSEDTRASAAKRAAREFLLSMTSSRDQVGMASFNTRYELLMSPTRDLDASGPAMDRIVKPVPDDGYTELYGGIVLASRDLGTSVGRRALVVLSDGENFPWFKKRGSPSPIFGEKDWQSEEALDEAVRQGITIFAVHFGTERDNTLSRLAVQSGGEVFDARNGEELAGVYRAIRENIRQEILLEYPALMLEGDRRWVRLVQGRSGSSVAESAAGARPGDRYYYTGTVFGASGGGVSPWLLLLIPLALLFPLIIALIRFEKPSLSANLSLLYATGAGHGTRMFAIGDRTIIGSDATADITIAGNSRLESSPVTIVKDDNTGRYTIVSEEAVNVNNRTVTKKTLENGDVINFNGTLAVFDDQDPEAGGRTIVRTREQKGLLAKGRKIKK